MTAVAGRLALAVRRSLLERLQARNEAALSELYDRIAPWVLGLAVSILGDGPEAEAVLSDVFADVWDRLGQLDASRASLVPWVLGITRARALAVRRPRWRRPAERMEGPVDDDGAVHMAAESPMGPADSGIPGWAAHLAILSALASLPGDERHVVALAYFDGLAPRAIARRLGEAPAVVEARLRAAQQRLAHQLVQVEDWMAWV